jgi:hypothetical protein
MTWAWKNRAQKLLRNFVTFYSFLIKDKEIVVACGNTALYRKEITEFCLMLIMLDFLCE